MDTNIKAYKLFWDLYNNDETFKNFITHNLKVGKVRFFNDNGIR